MNNDQHHTNSWVNCKNAEMCQWHPRTEESPEDHLRGWWSLVVVMSFRPVHTYVGSLAKYIKRILSSCFQHLSYLFLFGFIVFPSTPSCYTLFVLSLFLQALHSAGLSKWNLYGDLPAYFTHTSSKLSIYLAPNINIFALFLQRGWHTNALSITYYQSNDLFCLFLGGRLVKNM